MPGLIGFNALTTNGAPMLVSMDDFAAIATTVATVAGQPATYTAAVCASRALTTRAELCMGLQYDLKRCGD